MGLFKNNNLQKENEQLKQMLTPEMQNYMTAQQTIGQLNTQIQRLQNTIVSLNNQISNKNSELSIINTKVREAQSHLADVNDTLMLEEVGFYQPRYPFSNSEAYKTRLSIIREQQKQLIKNGSATSGMIKYQVNGNMAMGNRLANDLQKLLLRAFNTECDDIINKVKYNNLDASRRRIDASCNAISKLGRIMNIIITKPYHDLKVEELYLSYEYQQKKQAEKEEMRAARAAMREAEKLQREIEAQRVKFEKEQMHYQNALLKVKQQLATAPTPELLNKLTELENRLSDIDIAMKDLDYREANQRAGYVYIISNIGSFGENVYKIGMTRRLDPQDRVDELGDASVPFRFDVHAMIFSDDAPALEAALHRAFEDKKVNMINQRREFFNVTLDEIKEVVKANYDKTVEFIDYPDAEQYRQSLALRHR